jgi:hypothetical protein
MRLLQTVCALLAVTSMANAQAGVKPQPRIGIVGGVNLASLSDADGTGSRTGFIGGVMLSLPLANNFAFQPELLYTMKGATDNSSDVTSTVKLSYVELPLLLRLDIPASGGVKPFVYAGPSFALKTSCDVEGESGGTTESLSCDDFAKQVTPFGSPLTFASADVGGIVGGGLAFDVGGRALTVGVRYELGFVSISSDSDSKNRVLSFVGTFEWPFHR